MMKPLPMAPMRQSRRMGGGGMWFSARSIMVEAPSGCHRPLEMVSTIALYVIAPRRGYLADDGGGCQGEGTLAAAYCQ
jgi:hypothetical protein